VIGYPSGQDAWSYLARSGLPAVSSKKNFLKNYKINPLLTKLVRSRWLVVQFLNSPFFPPHIGAAARAGSAPTYGAKRKESSGTGLDGLKLALSIGLGP